MTSDEKELDHAYRVAVRRFFSRSYVTGVTVGEKMKSGKYLSETVVRVHVREKMPNSVLRKNQIFPKEIEGVRLDVIERVYQTRAGSSLTREERRLRNLFPVYPLQPGVGVSRSGGEAGTLGLVVWDLETGAPGFLTAAHVFRQGHDDPTLAIDSVIVQPAFNQGWHPAETTIARRYRWDPDIDAAFVPFLLQRRLNSRPLGLDEYTPQVRQAQRGDIVVKSGQTTGVTVGRVEAIGKIQVSGRTLQGFEIRPLVNENPLNEEISEGGDSGSIWFHRDSREPVGLNVAGDRVGTAGRDEHALACHLEGVLERLDVSLVPLENSPTSLLTDDEAAAMIPS